MDSDVKYNHLFYVLIYILQALKLSEVSARHMHRQIKPCHWTFSLLRQMCKMKLGQRRHMTSREVMWPHECIMWPDRLIGMHGHIPCHSHTNLFPLSLTADWEKYCFRPVTIVMRQNPMAESQNFTFGRPQWWLMMIINRNRQDPYIIHSNQLASRFESSLLVLQKIEQKRSPYLLLITWNSPHEGLYLWMTKPWLGLVCMDGSSANGHQYVRIKSAGALGKGTASFTTMGIEWSQNRKCLIISVKISHIKGTKGAPINM